MAYVLGIDIGTGSTKAVAVNLEGNSFDTSQQHYPFSTPHPGYHEQDPEQIWDAFTVCIKEIVGKIQDQPMAIGLSSAMHSLIPVDKNCSPLAPMITWADNRSAGIAMHLKATKSGMSIYKETGTPIHPMSPLCKLIWLRENKPDIFKQAHKFISIKEFIWYKLFAEFTIDHSIASSTGLFDIKKLQWHKKALELAGITGTLLSKPVATNYSKVYNGNTVAALKQNIPFVIGASDGCLANLGSMADRPGIAAITVGTSGAVRVASNKPLPNIDAMTFSYILDKETFICGGPINNGGVAMQWWLKNLVGPNPADQDYENLFAKIAEVPAGSNGLIFLPYLTGERAPIWDSESCGNFFGIRLQHGQAHFSRAVLEGICYALKDVLDAVQKNAEEIVQINVSGGFTKSEVWLQALSDITGKKLAILQADDASAVGAAFLTLKTIGAIKEYPSAGTDLKIFKPIAKNRSVYDHGFIIYKQLYADLKDTMHKVYKTE
jgi:gluconokinase